MRRLIIALILSGLLVLATASVAQARGPVDPAAPPSTPVVDIVVPVDAPNDLPVTSTPASDALTPVGAH